LIDGRSRGREREREKKKEGGEGLGGGGVVYGKLLAEACGFDAEEERLCRCTSRWRKLGLPRCPWREWEGFAFYCCGVPGIMGWWWQVGWLGVVLLLQLVVGV
jgi:hypothetical protein